MREYWGKLVLVTPAGLRLTLPHRQRVVVYPTRDGWTCESLGSWESLPVHVIVDHFEVTVWDEPVYGNVMMAGSIATGTFDTDFIGANSGLKVTGAP